MWDGIVIAEKSEFFADNKFLELLENYLPSNHFPDNASPEIHKKFNKSVTHSNVNHRSLKEFNAMRLDLLVKNQTDFLHTLDLFISSYFNENKPKQKQRIIYWSIN